MLTLLRPFSAILVLILGLVLLPGMTARAQGGGHGPPSQDFTLDLLDQVVELAAQSKADAAALLAAQQRQEKLLWWLAGAGLLLLCAGVAAGLALGQTVRRQTREQAEAMQANAETLRQTVLRLQRPLLAVEPAGLNNLGPYVPVLGLLNLRNLGASPALRLRQRAALKVMPYPLDIGFAFEEDEIWPEAELPVLAPGATAQSQAPGGPFPPAMLAGLIEGQQNRLYLVGSVAYEDALGNAYRSDFCHALRFDQPAALADAIRQEQAVSYSASFERAALHNEGV